MKSNKDAAERVIFEILSHASNGLYRGQLYNAFWLAHLYYAKDARGFLSDWPVVRLHRGPGIDKGPALIREMVDAGKITQETIETGPIPSYLCRAITGAAMTPLSDDAIHAIKKALMFVEGQPVHEWSSYCHHKSRSWIEGIPGEIMTIYSDQIPDDEYEQMKSDVTVALEEYKGLFQ